MNLKRYDHGAALAFPLAILASLWCLEAAALNPPLMAVDPNWPKPLPNGWVTGQVGGTCIDSQDHVFIVTRGFQTGGLTSPEGVGGANPSTGALGGAFKSRASPPVIEFDPAGNMINAWGNPALVPAGQPNAGQNAVLPNGMHGCYVDYQDNVWIGGNGDGVVQKYTHDGSVMLLQIGTKFVCDRPDLPGGTGACANGTPPQTGNSRTLLNLPAAIAVDPNPDPMPPHLPGSIYIADGYYNHRVIVFDSETGVFKRMWGAYGKPPTDEKLPPHDPGAAPPQQFNNPVHCVKLASDGLVYVCDRVNDRIQVFRKDGSFVREFIIENKTLANGSVWDLEFFPDTNQSLLLNADGANNEVRIVDRDTGKVMGAFGRNGRRAGEFHWVHNLAVDSKGNVFTTEVDTGKRAQKFLLQGNMVLRKRAAQ